MRQDLAPIRVTMTPSHLTQDRDDVLARFHFGGGIEYGANGCDHGMTLPVIDGQPLCEEWCVDGPVKHGLIEDFACSRSEDVVVLSWVGGVDKDVRNQVRQLYSRLLRCLETMNFPFVVKGWNHVPDISRGEGDSERYRQFCLGRAEAFDAMRNTGDMPAGTAVGSPASSPMQVLILATREAPLGIENPRQISAFRYPRQYGPRSPSFSRAALVGRGQMFVSGTAAIVGHESRHAGSIELQIQETIDNWRALLDKAAAVSGGARKHLEDVLAFRVYLRDGYCLDIARTALANAGIDQARVAFLGAEICRPELLFELDGIVNF